MATETPTQRLATLELGEDVVTFIGHRRTNGTAWRIIARDIYTATEGRIDVTHETLRTWYTEAAASTSAP
jgi:hypothetical protein